ncbi:MAG: transcriptional regulator [Oscillospiraceae bacterium]|nr:transcriptional regulator [Oscillospiraceae bacterium]
MKVSEIDFCVKLAKGIARQFGPNCEVVVHDLCAAEVEHSIVAIENGHISGRRIGDGPSHVVWEALKADPKLLEDRLAYLTRTEDGKILKSSTIFLRDDSGKPVGIFAINYDITMMKAMEDALHVFTAPEEPSQEPETITHNVNDLLEELIKQSSKIVGKPVALMNKEDKVKAIRFLNESGAFLITKAGQRVCNYFGISKYTLYSYIDEAKGEKDK